MNFSAKLISTFACCVCFYFATAQKPKDILKWMNTVKLENKDFYYEIPFAYRNDHIVIQVKVGGEYYDYVFDTGGYNDITDEIQTKNQFPVLTRQTVGSANQLKSSVNIVKVDSFAIADLVFKDISALQMNFDKLPSMCGINGALIGASIIKKLTWRIDFPRKTIIVTDDFSKLPPLPGSVRIPVTFNNRLMPFIEAKMDGKSQKFLFDTGSSSLISLKESTAKKYIRDKERIEISGAGIEGGNGVVKNSVYVFKANSFQIGEAFQYSNKPVLYTSYSNEDLIGNPIIKDAIVTLNFPQNELYLAPIPDLIPKEGWTSFGFTMEHIAGKMVVASIFSGLPAQKAGLNVDEEILSINQQPINCTSMCACKLQMDQLLQNADTLRLEVRNKNGNVRLILLNREKIF